MKKSRHQKIIELVGRMRIGTQEELADILNREGYKVTQATVSRDIKELKLSKVTGNDGTQYYQIIEKEEQVYSEKYIDGSGYTYYLEDPVTGLKTTYTGNDMYPGSGEVSYVYFEADRKTGTDFYRSYRLADPDLVLEISKLDEYRDANYPLNCGLLGYPLSVELVDDYGNRVYSFTNEEKQQLMDTYFDEFRKNYDEEGINVLYGDIYKYQLICRYEMVYNEESTSTHFFYIYLKDNDRRTVELIERLTGITIDELVNYNYDDYGYYEDEYYIEPY